MISFDDAISIIRSAAHPINRSECIALDNSIGRVLIEPLLAAVPNPKFNNSGVDGYALPANTPLTAGSSFPVVAEIRAGQTDITVDNEGAVRIFTGAPIPEGIAAVAMQEDVVREGDRITLNITLSNGANIRQAGSDFPSGEVLLPAGTVLGPAELAICASQGLFQVNVYVQPRVTLLVSGDELIQQPNIPNAYQIYDSNGPMLAALLHRDNCIVVSNQHVDDTESKLESTLLAAADSSDCIVVSGGASVGDYDFLPRVMQRIGEILFYKVKVRPGKPFLLGRIGGALVAGLPGNPAGAYVCYQLFVRELLSRLSGKQEERRKWLSVEFEPTASPPGRDDFVRCKLLPGGIAERVHEQGSFGLLSLSAADCLVRVPEGKSGRGRYDALLL